MDERWGAPSDTAADRLALLRDGQSANRMGTADIPARKRAFSRELVLGLVLLLLGALVVLVFMGRNTTSQLVATPPSIQEETDERGTLSRGEALTAALVEQGNYPPELSRGDSVVIIVTPQSSVDGVTRMLQETATVVSVDDASSGTFGAVVTLMASESVARDIADAGSVHLAIVPRVN